MQYKFLNIFLDKRDLPAQSESSGSKQLTGEISPFLRENNLEQIEQLYEFYKSNSSILYVNGFSGTGKAKLVDYSLNFLSKEAIVLKYNCFNSTVLDDILLSFFVDFKKLAAQKTILEPKVKTENFTQKINSYFTQIEKPFVVIINSFEAVLEENRKEILDFIFHLNTIPKIKTIIIGRTFESKEFSGIEPERLTIYALESHLFESYLKSEKIKYSNVLLEEFYRLTRGYYFLTMLSIKLMRALDMSLHEFLNVLKESFLSYPAFLEKKLSELIPVKARNLFWFLSMLRHPISIDLLKTLNLYEEDSIKFLIDFLIISEQAELIYVQDFFREQVDYSSAPAIAQKIHSYIIDLYTTQLPLKPLDRNILISRQTMRKEIEFHSLFLPKRPRNIDNSKMSINYLSYARSFEHDSKQKHEEPSKDKKQSIGIDLTQRKNISINLENLPFQHQEIPIEAKQKEIAIEANELSLKDLIKLIKRAEFEYHYAEVLNLCQIALQKKADESYQTYLPMVYAKLAHAYQKLADYENSLKYYNLAKEHYLEADKLVKANYVKLGVAKIFYDTYKLEKSKEILSEIISDDNSTPLIKVKAYLQLINIEETLSNSESAFDSCRAAIELSDESMGVKALSELYFKYALALDDKNDVRNAIKYYEKCINLSQDTRENKFLSSAYSNIATLYMEKNDIDNAIENYKKAFQIDKNSNNIEGTYYSASKLASILQRKQPENALEYFNIALDYAGKTKDVFYIVSASLAVGDFYYDRKQNEKALKNYVFAFNLAKNNFSQDNINKINIRINDIKFRLGVEKFEELMNIIEEQLNGQE